MKYLPAFAALMLAGSAFAEDGGKTTFAGIEVGGDFRLGECPAMADTYARGVYDFASANLPCWADVAPGQHGPVKSGDLPRVMTGGTLPDGVGKVYVKVIDGKVSYVDAWTDGFVHQESLYSALVAKFGPAATVDRSKVKAGSGAEFERISARWEKPDVTFTSMVSSIDEGLIQVYSGDGYQKALDEAERKKGSF